MIENKCKQFEESMKVYGLSVSVEQYSEEWPRTVISLNADQLSKLKQFTDDELDQLLLSAERIAKEMHEYSTAYGTPKHNIEGSTLEIKASLTVTRLVLEKIFK